MTSEKQIAANRLNAQKSTGPRTEGGKAKSSMNGFTSHITGLTTVMTAEDQLAQETFVNGIIADFNPVGNFELHLARTIAIDSWRITRIKTTEENMFAIGQAVNPYTHDVDQIRNAMGHAHTFTRHAKQFNTLSLYESRLTRLIRSNIDLLNEMQAKRRKEEEARKEAAARKPEPIHQPQHHHAFAAQNGFAPHTPEPASETPLQRPLAA